MSRRANPTVVGAFIVGGIGLTVAAIIVFGSGKLFKNTVDYISWFENSVNGLNVGAPVKFMGVTIGEVTAVRLRTVGADAAEDGSQLDDWEANLRIPVFYELDRDLLSRKGSVVDVGDSAVAYSLVRSGMRAELSVESILTGRKYISLSLNPDSPMNLVNDPNVDAFEIPTISTGLEWLERDVQGLMAKLTALDVEGLVEAITGAANDISELASGPETRDALAGLPATLTEMRAAMQSIQDLAASADTTLESVRPRIDAGSADFQAATEELSLMLETLRAAIEPGAPLLTNLEKSLYEIGIAAAAMGELADYLQQNPSALLRGKDVEDNR